MRSPLVALLLLASCTWSSHAEVRTSLPTEPPETWSAVLAQPGLIEHEAVVSARATADLDGLLDLSDPAAAHLENGPVPIEFVVHVLRHPEHGVFIVDTGVYRDIATGERGIVRGLVRNKVEEAEVVEPLGDILDRQPAPLTGVLITHMHLDHVLGLPDVPADVPVYIGPGDQTPRSLQNAFLRPTYRRLLADRPPLRAWDHAPTPPPVEGAVDVLGDGSLWALSTPGHTPGNTAFLVLTTDGPLLLVGDNAHTWWGWEHGVVTGGFTVDHDAHAESLARLKALVEAHPAIRVQVGHETDGEGTGVDDMP